MKILSIDEHFPNYKHFSNCEHFAFCCQHFLNKEYEQF
jgi:hypothetical protein